MKKLLALAIFAVFSVMPIALGATVSVDNVFTNADIHSSAFASKLNRNTTQMVNGINSVETTQIKNGTIKAEDMADEASPIVRTRESASCPDVIYSGLLPSTSATLTADISAGTGYPEGVRVTKASATSKTFTASKWTWVYVDTNGDFQYQEVAIGGATPATPANSAILARVSSDATTVNTVTDLRVTSCTAGPFDIIADATGEATLGNVLGNPGWGNGLNITTKDATSVYLHQGTAYINGEYRALTTATSIPINTLGSSVQGTSGLDAGSVAGSTTYFLYGTADVDGTKPVTGIFSTSSSAPTGATNYVRLGEVTTAASGTIATADVTSVSQLGKIIQIKKFQTGAVATGTTAIPEDDTIPQITEGDEYMTLSFTPTDEESRLKIDVVWQGSHSENGMNVTAALFQGATANALSVGVNDTNAGGGGSVVIPVVFTHYMIAGTTSTTTFRVRAGGNTGATITFNGILGARKYGGVLASSITVTEYQA
jgi:hypothetical protein